MFRIGKSIDRTQIGGFQRPGEERMGETATNGEERCLFVVTEMF